MRLTRAQEKRYELHKRIARGRSRVLSLVQPQRQHPNQGCKNTLEITAGLWCTTNTPNTVSEDLAPRAPTPAHPCCPCAAAPSFLHSRRFLYVREQNNSIKSPSCQLPALRDEQQIFLDEHLGGDAGHTTLSCLPYATQGRNHPCKLSAGRQPDLGEDRLLRLQDSKTIAPWS